MPFFKRLFRSCQFAKKKEEARAARVREETIQHQIETAMFLEEIRHESSLTSELNSALSELVINDQSPRHSASSENFDLSNEQGSGDSASFEDDERSRVRLQTWLAELQYDEMVANNQMRLTYLPRRSSGLSLIESGDEDDSCDEEYDSADQDIEESEPSSEAKAPGPSSSGVVLYEIPTANTSSSSINSCAYDRNILNPTASDRNLITALYRSDVTRNWTCPFGTSENDMPIWTFAFPVPFSRSTFISALDTHITDTVRIGRGCVNYILFLRENDQFDRDLIEDELRRTFRVMGQLAMLMRRFAELRDLVRDLSRAPTDANIVAVMIEKSPMMTDLGPAPDESVILSLRGRVGAMPAKSVIMELREQVVKARQWVDRFGNVIEGR